ncbi:MAG: hypothetical protein K0S56_109 [Microvirga sp.]|jgi:succinoglycan biosynthesis transport protein ExoP|nr:hypothetical protein [Microvirga sp.]
MMHGRIPISEIREGVESFDFNIIVDFLWRRWKLIAVIAGTVIAFTMLILFTLTPRYTSSTQILLDLRSQRVSGIDELLPAFTMDMTAVDSQISIIESSSLLRRVVEKEQLVDDPEFGASARGGNWLSSLMGFISSLLKREPTAAPQADASADAIPPDVLASIGRLSAAVEVKRLDRTKVLQIDVTSESPQKAARLANAIADAFIVDQLEARFDNARRAANWLGDRLTELREDLRRSEEAVEDFRSKNNLVMTNTGTVNEQQLSEINGKLVGARAEAAEAKAKLDQATRIIGEKGNIQAIPDVLRSSVISNLRTQQAEVVRREADLVSRYGDRHPGVVNVRAERREIERQITNEVDRIVGNLKNAYDVTQSRVDSLTQSVAILTGQAGSDNTIGVQLRELERVASANKTLYESFLSQSKLAAEQTSFEVRDARIISVATPPGRPSFPKKPFFLAVATVLGGLLGLGVAGLLELLNSGFNSPRRVEDTLGLPVLTSVERIDPSELAALDGKATTLARYLDAKPLSKFSESIRSLKTGIQMSDVDNPPKIVQLTSSLPREGKTSMAISLAISAAMSGKRVILVDCDLRRPSASQIFGLTDVPGVVELLANNVSPEGILHRDKASGLYVLPAGGKTQNPPDLLSSARMEQLFAHLRESFDLVIVDTPPIGPVVDAVIVSQIVDKTVFVVAWNSTTREVAQQAVRQISLDRKIAGVILNKVDERYTPKYGKYSYYSSAYYKGYYVQ